jgi:LPS-assembly protein
MDCILKKLLFTSIQLSLQTIKKLPLPLFILFSASSLAQETSFISIPLDPTLCPGGLGVPQRPLVEDKLEAGDIHITADTVDLIEEGHSHLEGNVELKKDQQQAKADIVDYYTPQEKVDLDGDVNYWDESLYLNAPKAHLDLDAGTGVFQNANYKLLSNWARGDADELFIDAGTLTQGKNIDFSTCEPQKSFWDLSTNIWKISAKSLTLNHETARGTAKHAVLKIKDIPVFYTPYMSFPLDAQRKSGFLMPSYGSSSRNGLEFRTPYYWNIAPNMDATLTPRYLTDSGLMGMGEFRYLMKSGSGSVNVEYLPGDDQFQGKDRSFINFEHVQTLFGRGRLDVLYKRVSDRRYFEDFGGTLTTTSLQYLERHANFSLSGKNSNYMWKLYTNVQDFQIVNESLPITSRPYKRLPRVLFNADSIKENNTLNYHLKSEMVYFERGNDPLLNNVEGFRFDLFPSVSYPMKSKSGYLKPKLGLRYTQYQLNNNLNFKKSPNRVLPSFSLNSGLYFDKEGTFLDHSYSQTLEPKLYYLYVPKEDQSDLPIFDTTVYDLASSYKTLFYADRFNGADRMGDSNQITLSLTSRFNIHNTKIKGSFTVGQAFFLEDREVVLPGKSIQTEAYSPIIAEYTLKPSKNILIRGNYQWDYENSITRKVTASAQYRPTQNKVINLSYRVVNVPTNTVGLARTKVEQTDASFSWPLGKDWNVIGRWNYDLPRKKSIEMFGGVEYNSCCWAFRAVGRRFLTNLKGDFQTGFFLQFELKGLAGVGQLTVDFLSQQIPGYKRGF